jgi:hypothetical protein
MATDKHFSITDFFYRLRMEHSKRPETKSHLSSQTIDQKKSRSNFTWNGFKSNYTRLLLIS